MKETAWDDARWGKRYEIVYSVQMNRLYHHKRERFFALCDRCGKALALIAGTAAASALLKTPEAKAIAGSVVAAVTLPGLVFGWADKARLHAELTADYARIESEIEAAGVLNWSQLDAFSAKVLHLGVKEPAGLSALIRLCQNELAIAANQVDKVFPLKWYERILVHVFDFPLERSVSAE